MTECSEEGGFQLDADTLTVFLGVGTLIGSVVAYFVQRAQEARDQAEAERQRELDIDREQALARVRLQLSAFVGPAHRLYKTFSTATVQYCIQSGHGMEHAIKAMSQKGSAMWSVFFREDFLQPFITEPQSFDAQCYRNFVSRRLKPLYTRLRELILAHLTDLADLPSQSQWLEKYDRASITSPIVGSLNVNVIFDSFSVWTFEFDDIIESWAEDDFRRMQPTTVVNWIICNELMDWLYEQAKMKEAKYNKHVAVHTNQINADVGIQLSMVQRASGLSSQDVLATA